MKKLLLALLLSQGIAFSSNAQSNIPDRIHFTAVARDAGNNPIANQNVQAKVQFYNADPASGGTLLYCEQSLKQTNAFGEFSLDFGSGNPNLCVPYVQMQNLDWSTAAKWVDVSFDANNTGSFTSVYTGPFASVPYSFAARTAEKLVTPGATTGQVLKWNGTAWAPGTDNAGSTGTTYTAGSGIAISGSNVISNTAPAITYTAGTGISIAGGVVSNTAGVPVGTIIAYAGSTAPAGWLVCDGQSYSTAAYPNLYTAIASNWGSGGAGSFNVPDLRGMFLRGKDGSAGNDPDAASRTANNPGGQTGNNVGSEQGDAFQGHNHEIRGLRGTGGTYGPTVASSGTNNAGYITMGGYSGGDGTPTATEQDGTHGTPRYGFETRPKNVYVLYIIKY